MDSIMWKKGMLFIFQFFLAFSHVKASLLIKNRMFREGEHYRVFCDATSSGVQVRYKRILRVKMLKDGNLMATIRNQDGARPALAEKVGTFSKTGWSFLMPSLKTLSLELVKQPSTRQYMTISARKSTPRCADSGTFKCSTGYFKGGIEYTSEDEFTFVGVGKLEIQELMTSPAYMGNRFHENEDVSVTCTALGTDTHDIQFQKKCSHQNSSDKSLSDRKWKDQKSPDQPEFETWPNKNKVRPLFRGPALINGQESDCNTKRITKELVFTFSSALDGCQIKCQLGKELMGKFAEEVSSTMTLHSRSIDPTFPGRLPPDQADSSEFYVNLLVVSLALGLPVITLLILAIKVVQSWDEIPWPET